MNEITRFVGQYRFLSNFYPAQVKLGDITFPTTEHAYQAAKTIDRKEREFIARLNSPGLAKSAGRNLKLRFDWEDIKIEVMRELLKQKFAKGTDLAFLLSQTGNAYLVEGNAWGDTFWGVFHGHGKNNLGLLLMQIREDNKYHVHEDPFKDRFCKPGS